MVSDIEIVELFFKRSELAIEKMAEKYDGECKRFSYRILNNINDAEECVNDSYLAVWNTVPPKEPNPLKAYLFKIVRNISIAKYNKLSAQKRNSHYDKSLEEISDFVSGDNNIYDEISYKELVKCIESFLDSLSKENRVIFIRRYWFCDTYKDISKLVGMSEKNVSVRLYRIRNQLKVFMKDREML